MKIVAVLGSPRLNANSEVCVLKDDLSDAECL